MLPIEKAYEIVGGISAMARHFNLTPWAVSKWREKYLRNVAQRLKNLQMEKSRNPNYVLICGINLPTFTKRKP